MPSNKVKGLSKEIAPGSQLQGSILLDDTPFELQVLLSACRAFLGTENPAQLEALLSQELDWDRLFRLSNSHGMMQLLYRSISQCCPKTVPQEWQARLKMQYMRYDARNLKMTTELLRLLEILEATGIRAIPFKGPALAQQVYMDVSLRTFGDLDILVHKEDVLRAKDVLNSEDYLSEIQLNPAQEKIFLRSDCEYDFNNESKGIVVEVHWRVTPSCYCINYDLEDVWPRTRMTILEGRSVRALSVEDLLIALSIHGARHHNWRALKNVCDVAALVNGQKDLDWNWVLSYAHQQHFERLILLGLLLAERFFKVQLPEEALSRIDKNQALLALSARLEHNFDGSELSSRLAEETTFWFQARERNLDRLSCIIRLALEPAQTDLMKTPLPVWLYPLYYLIHPARLLAQYGSNKGRR